MTSYFFFCNKPITSTANGYTNAVEVLKKANIDVQLITDTAILDLIRNKYSYLGLYYFGNHSIRQEWFVTHTSFMLDELGERYNRNFNVETVFSNELSLFIHDRKAAEYLNAKKIDLLGKISELSYRSNKKDYLRKLEEIVLSLPDVDVKTLYHSIEWISVVQLSVVSFLDNLTEERKRLETERNEKYMLSAKLIEIMNLRQQKADGFYYDSNGTLAAFDTDLTQKINSVVVRKDILDTFLDKIGMKLVWLVDAEKEVHAGDYSITKWSDWEAVFTYERDSISGEIRRLQR